MIVTMIYEHLDDNKMVSERVLDTSGLEAPEPLQQALAVVDTLKSGEYLRLLIRRDPILLYPLLISQGYKYVRHSSGHGYEVLIWHENDTVAAKLVQDQQTRWL